MTTEEEVSNNREELNEARKDLHDTLTKVSAKAEHLEGKLRLDHLIERSPIGAPCLAGALGFIIGSRAHRSALGPAMIVALLGYAISKSLSEHGNKGNGTAANQ